MTGTILIAITLLAGFLYYAWVVLPTPFFRLESPERRQPGVRVVAKAGRSKAARLLRAAWGFLRCAIQQNPSIELPEPELAKFVWLFREPLRPIVDRRALGDYYVDIPLYFESLRRTGKTVVVFPSRFALATFPVRFVVDHALSLILNHLLLAIYLSGVTVFAAYIRLTGPDSRRNGNAQADERVWFKRFVSYLNGKGSVWEFGFLLFKALEGFQFSTAIRKYGFAHPNCEFGVETGLISTTHLGDVDFIDVGCEAIEDTPFLGDIVIKRKEHCYLESNPFPDASFRNIYLVHVVDHIPDLARAFQELNRITMRDGYVFFSGLTHLMAGAYLERFVYQGTLHNNRPLSWFESLARASGFEVLYQSYLQSGLAFRFWRFTAFFHHRTQAWIRFTRLYKASPAVRRFYEWAVRTLLLELFVADRRVVAKRGEGVNFMMVIRKVGEPAMRERMAAGAGRPA